MKIYIVLIIIMFNQEFSYTQTSTIDWASYTLSDYNQRIILPTGEEATIIYSSPFNSFYESTVNSAYFSFGPTNTICAGMSNTGDEKASGILIAEDYGDDLQAAKAGKTWKIVLSTPISDVSFNIYNISSLIHSWNYPYQDEAIYNDQVIVQGKDENGATIYPTLSRIGTTFMQGLNTQVSACAYENGKYEDHFEGDVDKKEFFVENETPPTAYVSAGSITASSGDDSDCFSGGFIYSMDINIDFGHKILSEITITYKNHDNTMLGVYGGGNCTSSPRCGLSSQSIFIGDISYNQKVIQDGFISFLGDYDGNKVVLNWTSTSELNNEGYEIQHSIDGVTFNDLAFIESKKTGTLNPTNYSHVTNTFVQGFNYYRLNQKNYEGITTNSDILSVNVEDNSYDVYPNPIISELNIKAPTQEEYTTSIYNINGCLIQKTINSTLIDFENMASGIFFVKIEANDIPLFQERLVKI